MSSENRLCYIFYCYLWVQRAKLVFLIIRFLLTFVSLIPSVMTHISKEAQPTKDVAFPLSEALYLYLIDYTKRAKQNPLAKIKI